MANEVNDTSPDTSNVRDTGIDFGSFSVTDEDRLRKKSQDEKEAFYFQQIKQDFKDHKGPEPYVSPSGDKEFEKEQNLLIGSIAQSVWAHPEYLEDDPYTFTKTFNLEKNEANNVAKAADPINLFNGEFSYSNNDFVIAGAGFDFRFTRSHSNQSDYRGPLGNKWDHIYNLWLRVSESSNLISRSTGKMGETLFKRHAIYDYWCAEMGEDAIIVEDGNGYVLKTTNGVSFSYQALLAEVLNVYLIKRIQDRFGNYLEFNYEDGLLSEVLVNHPARKVMFEYDSENRIVAISDFRARTWRYYYDDFDDLIAVTSPATDQYKRGSTTCYEYTTAFTSDEMLQHCLTAIIDASGQIYLENEYGSGQNLLSYNRVVRQRQGGGETFFDYENVIEEFDVSYEEHERPCYQTIVTQRNGEDVRYLFNYFGNLIFREQYARINGIPKLIGTHYRYNRDGNLVGKISPMGVVTQYLYGRDYYERKFQIASDYLDTEDENLDSKTRQSFNRVLGTVIRGVYYDITSLNLSNGLWKDIFPDIYSSSDEDIVQKMSFEPDFGQMLTISDVRFTRSADPDFDEDENYSRHLTRYSYLPDQNSLFHSLQFIQSPAITLPNATVALPAVIEINGIDERGRITKTTDAEGLVATQNYYDDTAGVLEGLLKGSELDPDGVSIKIGFERDSDGRIIKTYLPKSFEFQDGRFVIQTEYNEIDQITSTTSTLPFNIKIQKQYTRVGNLEKEILQLKNPDGTPQAIPELIRSFKYDEEFNLLQEIITGGDNLLQKKYRTVYDSANRLSLTLSPGGKKNKSFYDERSLLSKQVEDHGGIAAITKSSFDADGRVIKIIDPNGSVYKLVYDAPGRVVESEDPLGNKSLISYDKSGGLICVCSFEKKEDDRYLLLSRAAFTYDELGRKVKTSLNKFDEPIEVPANSMRSYLTEGPGTLVNSLFFYNNNGRLTKIIDHLGREYASEYDKLGRLVQKTDPYGNELRFGYDKAGNLVRSDRIDAVVDTTTNTITGHRYFSRDYVYDELNRLVEQTNTLGSKTKYSYDSRGLITQIVNPLGDELNQEYDLFGRCLFVTQFLKGGSESAPVRKSYQYNIDDLVTNQTDALGRNTSFRYDTMNRFVGSLLPDGSLDEMEYDKQGKIVSQKDRNGLIKLFQRDAVGMIVSLKLVTSSLSNGIDVEGEMFTNYSYDGLGRLIFAENEYSKSTLKYNSLGWVLAETGSYGPSDNETSEQSFKIEKEYTEIGTLSGITYPSGRKLSYERDILDRVVKIEQNSKGDHFSGDAGVPDAYEVMSIEYEGLQRKKINRSNETTTEYNYDAGGRMTEIKHSYVGGLLLQMQFLFDAAGNMRKKIEASEEINVSRNYSYDSLSRLVSVAKNNITDLLNLSAIQPSTEPLQVLIPDTQSIINNLFDSDTLPSRKYNYDLAGNRNFVEDDNAISEAYMPNSLDQYSSVNDKLLTYDSNGNLIEDEAWLYKYNHRNQLTSLTNKGSGEVIHFYHDHLGRKIRETTGNITSSFMYDRFDIVEEHNNGELLCSSVFDAGIDNLLQTSADGADYFYYADLNKSVRKIMRGGEKDTSCEYDEFGNDTNTIPRTNYNKVKFAGKRIIPVRDAYDFVYRTYDQTTGRFLQRDPLGYIDGANLYAFVRNNPLSNTDPLGTESRPELEGNEHEIAVGKIIHTFLGALGADEKVSHHIIETATETANEADKAVKAAKRGIRTAKRAFRKGLNPKKNLKRIAEREAEAAAGAEKLQGIGKEIELAERFKKFIKNAGLALEVAAFLAEFYDKAFGEGSPAQTKDAKLADALETASLITAFGMKHPFVAAADALLGLIQEKVFGKTYVSIGEHESGSISAVNVIEEAIAYGDFRGLNAFNDMSLDGKWGSPLMVASGWGMMRAEDKTVMDVVATSGDFYGDNIFGRGAAAFASIPGTAEIGDWIGKGVATSWLFKDEWLKTDPSRIADDQNPGLNSVYRDQGGAGSRF